MTQKFSSLQSDPRCPSLNSHGMALLLCLLLLTTLCLIGGAALSVSGLNHQIVHNGTKQVQAFYVAEAGRELALAYLNKDPMWRGGEVPATGDFEGMFLIGGVEGIFKVSLSDCTADENGILNELLPAGYVLMKSTGTWIDAIQTVSCIAHITPREGTEATFPQAAVVSSGPITGPLLTLDDLWNEDSLLLQTLSVPPEANTGGLRAMAGMAFSSLDNDAWDESLGGIDSFWLDPPADTRSRIIYVQEDLDISNDRRLYGIIYVAGSHVVLSGETCIHGILYAPNAKSIEIRNDGVDGRPVIIGQLVAGPGGVQVTQNQVAVQVHSDYVNAFNEAAGPDTGIDMVPGSWTRF